MTGGGPGDMYTLGIRYDWCRAKHETRAGNLQCVATDIIKQRGSRGLGEYGSARGGDMVGSRDSKAGMVCCINVEERRTQQRVVGISKCWEINEKTHKLNRTKKTI